MKKSNGLKGGAQLPPIIMRGSGKPETWFIIYAVAVPVLLVVCLILIC